MIQKILTKGIFVEGTARHIHVQFDTPLPVISSAVLNGGAIEAGHILNLSVRNQLENGLKIAQPPDVTLAEYGRI